MYSSQMYAIDTAVKAERELRLWIQNGILNSQDWQHFITGPNGDCRFDVATKLIYEQVRRKLADDIYKGGPPHGSHVVTLSSAKQNWLTPPYLLDIVRRLGPIALDPCANPQSFVNAWWSFYGPGHIDGLKQSWVVPENTVCFVNPPYGRSLNLWANKMAIEGERCGAANCHEVVLIPARVGTGYWEQFVWPFVDAVCFWHGGIEFPSRICFYELDGRPAKAGSTFDAAILYYGAQREKFAEVFKPYGTIQLVN